MKIAKKGCPLPYKQRVRGSNPCAPTVKSTYRFCECFYFLPFVFLKMIILFSEKLGSVISLKKVSRFRITIQSREAGSLILTYALCVSRDSTAAIESKTPRITPRSAANRTWKVGGNRNVIVCAGIQNRGIVFLKTKLH